MFFWNNNKKKQEVPVIEMVEVADIEKLIESSSSEFGKEMYNNHIS